MTKAVPGRPLNPEQSKSGSVKPNKPKGVIRKRKESDIKKTKLKVTGAIMFMIVLSAVSVIIFYTGMINDYKLHHEQLVKDYNDRKFDDLWIYLTEQMTYDAENNIKPATDQIQEEIESMDLVKLKAELDQNIYSDEFTNIFKRNLQDITMHGIDNGKNNTMVISNDFVILNYSYYLYPSNADDPHSFTDLLTSGYNVELSENAINKIYQQDDSMICIEMESSDNPDHIKVHEITKESLYEVYSTEGIEGLKNYQFLVPIYITEKGDVFGQDDIVHGERINSNHKFIVIQEFNLYDQLYINYSHQFDDSYIKNINLEYETTLQNMYILGFIFIGFVLLIVFEYVSIYNNFIYGYVVAIYASKDTE